MAVVLRDITARLQRSNRLPGFGVDSVRAVLGESPARLSGAPIFAWKTATAQEAARKVDGCPSLAASLF